MNDRSILIRAERIGFNVPLDSTEELEDEN
jgi:hypothetical protein